MRPECENLQAMEEIRDENRKSPYIRFHLLLQVTAPTGFPRPTTTTLGRFSIQQSSMYPDHSTGRTRSPIMAGCNPPKSPLTHSKSTTPEFKDAYRTSHSLPHPKYPCFAPLESLAPPKNEAFERQNTIPSSHAMQKRSQVHSPNATVQHDKHCNHPLSAP